LGWDLTEISHDSSVGELNPNCEAKVMADDGVAKLSKNQRGELWIRDPNIMKGYWQYPNATKETKMDG
jgi:long-subunit acyl-CoA synthetase (AMP-forming)